jgi:hypothetical protein
MIIKYKSEKRPLLHKLLDATFYTLLASIPLVIFWDWNIKNNIFFFIILILTILGFAFIGYPPRSNYTIIYDTKNDRIDIFYDFLFFFKKHKIIDTNNIKFHYTKISKYEQKSVFDNLGEYNLCFFDLKNNHIINIPDFSMGNGLNNKKGKEKLDDIVYKLRENGVQERRYYNVPKL